MKKSVASSLAQYKERLKKLQKLIAQFKVDGCLIEEPTSLFYLTGLQLSLGKLWITPEKACLFVDGRYIQSCKENSPVPAVLVTDKAIQAFIQKEKIKTVAFDSQATSFDRYQVLKKSLPKITWHPIPKILKEIRAIKDAKEIAAMKKSAKCLWKGFEHIKSILKVGITEVEVAREFEIFCLRHGAKGLAFDAIIAFGANSAKPHYRAGEVKLKKDMLVLVDIGVDVDDYHSDMTRIIFFGDVDPRLKKIYKVVRDAQRAAFEACRSGVTAGELELVALSVIREANMEHLCLHRLGHGIGLDTHEFPSLTAVGDDKNAILKPGMAVTLEPGLYIPGVGGVRYEDTVIVTAKGADNLYPRDKMDPTLVKKR